MLPSIMMMLISDLVRKAKMATDIKKAMEAQLDAVVRRNFDALLVKTTHNSTFGKVGKDNPLSKYLDLAEKKTGLSKNKLLAIGGTVGNT